MAILGRKMITLALLSGLLSGAAATLYNVGGDGGWTFQPPGSTFYDDQFKNVTVFVGDSLNFTFPEGVHNLLWVSQQDLANCSATSPMLNSNTAITITFNTLPMGSVGFICGFPQHCSQFGMHLNVTVMASSEGSPAPAPLPPSGPGR